MTDERMRILLSLRGRLEQAAGDDDFSVLFGPEADDEVQTLLQGTDLTRDLEVRGVVGWVFYGRSLALREGGGGPAGSAAGQLLLPAWAADPGSVPEDLAERFADRGLPPHYEPVPSDGPREWSALCAAATIAAEGRQHTPPADASPTLRELYAAAGQVADMVAATVSGPEDLREQLLNSALGAGMLAVLATPEDDDAYATRVADLSHAYVLAGRYAKDRDTFDTGLRLAHRALKAGPRSGDDMLIALSNLGVLLCRRYEEWHDVEDLYDSIGIARDALDQVAVCHRFRPRYLSNLGYRLNLRMRVEGGTPQEQAEIVQLLRQAAAGDPQGRGPGGLNLGNELVQSYLRTGRREDLDEAVSVLREALDAPWPSADERIKCVNALGDALYGRHRLTGDEADFEEATALFDEVRRHADGKPEQAQLLVNPALALRTRAERSGSLADLQEAVGMLRRAARLLPPGHPERPGVLSNLGMTLNSSQEHTGDPEELDEAVTVLREAVEHTPDGHPHLSSRLMNLGSALGQRYELTGDGSDLRESLECRRRAAGETGGPPADRAARLSSMGLALLQGGDRLGESEAGPKEAVGYIREAVELTPEGEPLLPKRRLNLALALFSRAQAGGGRKDLREARELVDAALAAIPEDAPIRANALVIAATLRLAVLFPSSATRDEAAKLLRAAVDATPPGHADRARRLSMLATLLRNRGGRPADEGAELYRAAALERQCPPSERLDAAREWGTMQAERGRWQEALEGFTVAVDLLGSLAPRHLVRDDQEYLLGGVTGLGAAAAACAVRCGRPGLAVQLLERSRGVLLAQAFDADSDLTRLRAASPGLAERFERLRDEMDKATSEEPFLTENPGDPGADEGASGPSSADVRRRLAAEWEELTGRIRAEHPELRLFRPVHEWDEEELRATAHEGPVVLVNVSEYGSDALLVTDREVSAVPLPKLDAAETARRRRRFEEALAALAAPETKRRRSLKAQQEVRDTLAWLWAAAARPVLDHLGPPAAADARPPRLWWSPGGALGALPLHAAGPADGSPGALERAVSSYTPTLRALSHARERAGRPSDHRMLVVSVPEAEGTEPLHGARGEAELLAGLLPGATVLHGEGATRDVVESALRGHAYAHFACHAVGDMREPSDNRLVLHDHDERSLTVRDLARLRLPGVRLAYLSACDTLGTSSKLADEAVHIVSAFQMAGFPHVVGSLWHVDDTVGARVTERVYRLLHTPEGRLDIDRTASALHTAVLEVRTEFPATPSLWACQVHVGP